MDIREIATINNRIYEITWHGTHILPPRSQITQVSAVCYTSSKQIVMISSDGLHWGIPGGHPESDEPLDIALSREVREEACCEIEKAQLLGWQHVCDLDNNSIHYQLRYCCLVSVHAFNPEHEITYRQLVPPDQFLCILEYGKSKLAVEMLRLAQKIVTNTS
ncbi:NUDIX domain-containing protein [bacterium]|nr:NUDIX domain-containing protein [bacterium]